MPSVLEITSKRLVKLLGFMWLVRGGTRTKTNGGPALFLTNLTSARTLDLQLLGGVNVRTEGELCGTRVGSGQGGVLGLLAASWCFPHSGVILS